MSAEGSQAAVPGGTDSPESGLPTEIPVGLDAPSIASPQPAKGDEISASPEFRPDDVPLPYSTAGPFADGAEDDVPTSGSAGSQLPVQPPEKPAISQQGKIAEPQEGSQSSVTSSPSGADLGVGNTNHGASADGADSGTFSKAAQAAGYRAKKATETEILLLILGVTLLLGCL